MAILWLEAASILFFFYPRLHFPFLLRLSYYIRTDPLFELLLFPDSDGREAARPYTGIPLFLWKEWLARPVQEVRDASWFFRPTALPSGLATPEIQ